MSFLSDLHSYWTLNPVLSGAIPASQVYTGLVPEQKTFPYAVIVSIGLPSDQTTGAPYIGHFSFQISIFATSGATAERLAETVDGQFRWRKIGRDYFHCEDANGPYLIVDPDSAQKVYHAFVEFKLSKNLTLPST